MSITYSKDSTTRINPRATLNVCDVCREHAPRFVTGVRLRTTRLCPSCAVNADLSAMHRIEAERLQAALIDWITKPNPVTDMPDDADFYAQFGARTWGPSELDIEAERNARKRWVAWHAADPAPSQDELDAAYCAAFWSALIADWNAA